jgi:hypothetical protein
MKGGAPLSAWPSLSTFTGARLRKFACFSDLICWSIRSLTSFASRAIRCCVDLVLEGVELRLKLLKG